MNPYAIPPLITNVLIIWIGFFVFVQNKKSKLNRIFSLFSLSMAVWLFGYTLMYLTRDPAAALFWGRIGFCGIIFIPVFAYHFIISFLNLKRKIVLPILYLLTIPSLYFGQTDYIYSGIKLHFWGFYPTAGKFYWGFLLMFAILFTKGVLLLFSHLRKETGLKREQIKYVCLAFGLGTFGLVDYLIKYPVFEVYPFGYVCALLFDGLIAVAIVRYQLLDIRVAVSRAVIGAIVFGFLLAIPWPICFFLRKFALSDYRSFWWLGALAVDVLGIGALYTPKVYRYFQTGAEKTLRKEEFHYHDILLEMAKGMTLIKDLDQLLRTIVVQIARHIRVSTVSVYLKEGEAYILSYAHGKGTELMPNRLDSKDPLIDRLTTRKAPILKEEEKENTILAMRFAALQANVLIPSLIRKEKEKALVGFLALGDKISGKVYTHEDLNVFEILAAQAALAIENALFVKEREELNKKLREAEKFKAVRQMMGAMDHELRNLMTRMSGPAQLILLTRKEKLDEEFTKIFKEVYQCGMLGAEILEDVRRYHQQSQKNELMEMDVAQALAASFEKLKKRLEEAGAQIALNIEPDLGRFNAKESFLELFTQLLKNSCFNLKITSEKKDLVIQAKKKETCAEVIIQDTGGDFTRVVKEDGFGGALFAERGQLGGVNLYLAQAIARDNGVELEVGSNQKIGALFRVRVPLKNEGRDNGENFSGG